MKKINNIVELFQASGLGDEDTLYYLGRCLYKYTDCGPWTYFLLNAESQDHEAGIYYESEEANVSAKSMIDKVIGIRIGSIVEGSDACVDAEDLMFPFTEKEFEDLIDGINNEASYLWERDNSDWYVVLTPTGSQIGYRNTWGEIKFNWDDISGLDRHLIEQMDKKLWIDEGGYLRHHCDKEDTWYPAPGLPGWEVMHYTPWD